jgi:hypothetical protein
MAAAAERVSFRGHNSINVMCYTWLLVLCLATVVEVRGEGARGAGVPAAPPLQRAPREEARPPFAQRAGGCPSVALVWQPNHTQVNATTAPGNKYGVEDGIVVRRDDGAFTMICAEMYADPKWVAMQLGVFHSADGLTWTRVRGLRKSTGDFTGASPHSSSWGPFLTRNGANDTWLLSYVGYRGAPSLVSTRATPRTIKAQPPKTNPYPNPTTPYTLTKQQRERLAGKL